MKEEENKTKRILSPTPMMLKVVLLYYSLSSSWMTWDGAIFSRLLHSGAKVYMDFCKNKNMQNIIY